MYVTALPYVTEASLMRDVHLPAPAADKERYEPLTPWCMFSPRHARVRHFARVINAPALSGIAELFLMNGDMCAWLYTGSPAMHSEKITMFEPESSRLKKAGAGAYSNSFIAIRRCAVLVSLSAGYMASSLARSCRVLEVAPPQVHAACACNAHRISTKFVCR
jgi:hypothetical protein